MATADARWSGTRVLVTGGGGFIGSHLAERLTALGARTRVLVRYTSRGDAGWLTGSPAAADIEIVRADIGDAAMVGRAMRDVEVVFHLAALIGIPYSYDAPASYVRTNVEGTVTVLEAARDAGVRRVVQTSTSEVYGSARYVPIDEAHPLQAQSPYSASKIAADQFADSFHRSFGLPVVTVRPFNTYGPRQSARAVIPTIITQALAHAPIALGNLTPTRDLTYVDDMVDGFLRAASTDAAIGLVINLGTGREASIGDLVALVGRILGRPLEVRADSERVRPAASEVDRLCASTARAREVLGWTPAASLEEGVAKTIEWIGANLATFRSRGYAV